MAYTPRSRDRYKSFMALLTGLTAFGTATATGAATGLAAHRTAVRDQQRQQATAFAAEQARAEATRRLQWQPRSRLVRVVRTRPYRTVVVTRVVHQVSRSGAATVGGGAVSAPVPAAPAVQSSGGTVRSTSSGPVAPPPPAPAPAPAPSSGS
jgi:hypothetical protein